MYIKILLRRNVYIFFLGAEVERIHTL